MSAFRSPLVMIVAIIGICSLGSKALDIYAQKSSEENKSSSNETKSEDESSENESSENEEE